MQQGTKTLNVTHFFLRALKKRGKYFKLTTLYGEKFHFSFRLRVKVIVKVCLATQLILIKLIKTEICL